MVWLGGHMMLTGAAAGRTVTVKLHVAALPCASMAVQVTVFVPSGKNDPEGGTQASETMLPQLLVAVGAG